MSWWAVGKAGGHWTDQGQAWSDTVYLQAPSRSAATAAAGRNSFVLGGPFRTEAQAAKADPGGTGPSRSGGQRRKVGGGPPPAYQIPAAGPVRPREIYALLQRKGLSTAQAVGVMANMFAESRLNPESGGTDSNGKWAGGLIGWNEGSYPNVRGKLVTGNPQRDVRAQVDYLFTSTNGVQAGLKGATAADVAGNWAANVERCQGCQPGSTIANGWTARRGYAAMIEKWVSSGNWPKSAGGVIATGGGGGGGGGGTGADCLISLPRFAHVIGGECLLTKSKARGLLGGLLIATAVPVGVVGSVILAAFAFRRTGAGPAVAKSAEAAGAAIAFVPGLEPAGALVAAAGSAEARKSQAAQKERQQKKAETTQRRDQAEARRTEAADRAQGRHDEAEYQKARKRTTAASSTAPPVDDIPPF